MPTEHVNRTLTLRTAVNHTTFGEGNGGPGSLSNLVNELHNAYTTVETRRALVGSQVIEGRNVHIDPDGTSVLHLVSYTPDDQIAVVPSAGNVPAADLALIDAPDGAEFLDGELMLLLSGNDVAICRNGMGENHFISYVSHLSREVGYDNSIAIFELFKRADIDKLRTVRQEGIRQISMKSLSHSLAVARVERESIRKSFLGDVWDEFREIVGVPGDIEEDVENLKVEVLFTFDKRNGTELDQRQLVALAEGIIADDEDEGFSIETLSGKKLRAQDIVISKAVRIRAYGKSVHHSEAWGHLREFWQELNRADGA